MELEKQERQNALFNQIAIWDLSGDQKTEIAEKIIEDVETGVEYWSQMILSAIIASLGLLINATPVVIGAMLIAPILRPIQAVAFATTTGNRRLFWKGTRLLILSIVVSIIAAIIITLLVPLSQITNEILARTQPTLIDLGIAFASGLVAFLAFGFKKIAAGLAGVAMAASLVPPLAVIGIGIGMLNSHITINSSVLFLTNLFAIIIAGIIIFYLFGYYPNQKKELKTSMINTVFVMTVLVLLSIPLATSLLNIINSIEDEKTIKAIATSYFQQVDDRIHLNSIQYTRPTLIKAESAESGLSLNLNVPQDIAITNTQQDELNRLLAEQLHQSLTLDLVITQYSSVRLESINEVSPLYKIQKEINEFLDVFYRPVILVESNLIKQSKTVLITSFYTDEAFDTDRFQQQLKDYLLEQGNEFDILITNRQTVIQKEDTKEKPLSIEETQRQETIATLSSHFRNEFPESTLQKLQLYRGEDRKQGVVEITSITTLSKEQYQTAIDQRKITAQEITDLTLDITSYVQFPEKIQAN